MFENIEEYVITSSRKTEDSQWIWTRNKREGAEGLARLINRMFLREGRYNVTITVLEVATGIATSYK